MARPPIRRPPPSRTHERGARRLPPLLRRAWYGLNQAFRRRVAHLDLTPDQYTVLRNLHEAGTEGLTQSELTTRMSSDPNTIASLVGRMARAGYLRRETDTTDRRARRLRLQTLGRERFLAGRRIATTLLSETLGALAPEEQEGFLGLLDKFAQACQEVGRRSPQ